MKNPTAFIAKDGVSDAGLVRATRDMYEALEFVAFALEHPGVVSTKSVLREVGEVLAIARGEA
jgi:hypothetical protein